MGFENRDYYREPSDGGGRIFGESVACWWLTVLTVGVFVAQNIPALNVERWLALSSTDVLQHAQVWRLVTYAFCHNPDDLMHLVFNLICLWFFGRAVEERLGTREFVVFYVISAAFAGVCYLGLEVGILKQEHTARVVGASGALMAVMAVFAIWNPRQQVMFMLLFPIEIRWLIAAFVAFDTIPIWRAMQGQQVATGVAHASHLGGLLFGFLYQLWELRLSDWVSIRHVPSWWRDRQRRRSMRLYRPETEDVPEQDLDDQVDQILRKIHDHGEASLNDHERKLLNEASRRYRERTRT